MNNEVVTIINEHLSKQKLLAKLAALNIGINKYAEQIFDHPNYNYENGASQISIAKTTLHELGLQNGGNFQQISTAMQANNFDYCPIEFAPYIRMHFMEQDAATKATQNIHPPDSYLIFSAPLQADENFPKGFYIRNIEGKLWLRAYTCSDDYCWDAESEIIVRVSEIIV